jgi:[glutamine synthetase] adenylyltransferase / [glutamine synthetase]-adenylyl-L-tyrosine phosphorylase
LLEHSIVPASGRSLARRIAAAPKVGFPDRARERLVAWLSAIVTPAGPGLRARLEDNPVIAALLEGLAEGSPFLWQLTTEDPERLLRLLDCDPEPYFETLLAKRTAAIAQAVDEVEVMRLLRKLKQEATLLLALADIGAVWEVMHITQKLTALADCAVATSLRFVLAAAAAEGRLKPPDAAHPDRGSGYFVLAMGKMGAFELNFSSDIDLIVLFDPAPPALVPGVDPGPLFVRLTRRLLKLLQTRTPEGYVFRVDLRLRPDPGSSHVAISTFAALTYYESRGQNWERAALIKARPCGGDLEAAEAFLKDLFAFIWRKYLDYAAIADIHSMKRQVHAFRGHGEIAVEGHNIKLGRGGIREIEFFVQTQQLITGGRHPELRGRETLAMLGKLEQGGWITAEASRDLSAAYRFLRTVEHRLQMVSDEQTQTLPAAPARLLELARFLGYPDRDAFADALVPHLRRVQQHYGALFEDVPQTPDGMRLIFPKDGDDAATLETLAKMGFDQPLAASSLIRRWLTGPYPSLRGQFARAHLIELVPLLIDRFSRTDAPDRALIAFDRFLANLHGGARLISLLLHNPDLVGLLALTLGAAPRLADIVALYPEAMDGLIDPTFFGALPDDEKLRTELARNLDQAGSYEDFLDRLRIFGQEHIVLIGVRILTGSLSAEQAGEAFARLADVLISALHKAVAENFVEVHGHLRRQQSAILALGKLGGREMTAGSDLDLILVYDCDPDLPQSDGARPLVGTQYFARFTQRIIGALSAPTNYGTLYKVDLRLRPSGQSGPLATHIDRFRIYHEEEAWTWEHMALTRARVVASSDEFGCRVEEVIRHVLCRRRDRELVAADILEMRRAIAAEKGDSDVWDLKNVSGGLVDLEFAAQYLQLIHAAAHPEVLDTSTLAALEKASRLGVLSAEDAEVLRPAARLYHNLTQVLRLCVSGPFDPRAAGAELLGLLARNADVPDFATLEAHLAETREQVRASFLRVVGGRAL